MTRAEIRLHIVELALRHGHSFTNETPLIDFVENVFRIVWDKEPDDDSGSEEDPGSPEKDGKKPSK